MRTVLLGFLLSLLFLPAPTRAETENIGFVQGIWYSEEPVFTGVPTRVYVAFRNNTPHDLTGTIRFTDNGKRIGSSYVNVLSGRIAEAWVDWTPAGGEHAIGVTLGDAELHAIGKNPEPIDITGIVTEDAVIVDTDTDGDKIGNKEDADDDGDGVSDEDERARGTNPLVANPKPVTEEEAEGETNPTEAPAPIASDVPSVERPGLEQYFPDSIASAFTEDVTEKIHDTKQSLDEYRMARNSTLAGEAETTVFQEQTLGTSTENATITRSRIEPDRNIIEMLVSGVATLLKNIYTFVLFLLSGALAHPAFVELVLLLSILYFFYRVARYFGRRPNW